MAQIAVNKNKILDKITGKLSNSFKQFNRQLIKKLKTPTGDGGIWAYDYNRRPDQKYPHSVSMWRKQKENVLRYNYFNDAVNNSQQKYAKYIINEPYHSKQLPKAKWERFLLTETKNLKRIIKESR